VHHRKPEDNFNLARFHRRSSAFIGGQFGVLYSRLTGEKAHLAADERR